jgi:hypothetical protein
MVAVLGLKFFNTQSKQAVAAYHDPPTHRILVSGPLVLAPQIAELVDILDIPDSNCEDTPP